MKCRIMTNKIRFVDENGHSITETNRPHDLTELEVGKTISPFNTPNGRVSWLVKYVEQIDLDLTLVYIKQLGFTK